MGVMLLDVSGEGSFEITPGVRSLRSDRSDPAAIQAKNGTFQNVFRTFTFYKFVLLLGLYCLSVGLNI